MLKMHRPLPEVVWLLHPPGCSAKNRPEDVFVCSG
jgi:hypothetical protein